MAVFNISCCRGGTASSEAVGAAEAAAAAAGALEEALEEEEEEVEVRDEAVELVESEAVESVGAREEVEVRDESVEARRERGVRVPSPSSKYDRKSLGLLFQPERCSQEPSGA